MSVLMVSVTRFAAAGRTGGGVGRKERARGGPSSRAGSEGRWCTVGVGVGVGAGVGLRFGFGVGVVLEDARRRLEGAGSSRGGVVGANRTA